MVERRQKAQKASRSSMPVSSAANTEERGCYYSGTVLNDAGSIASFSTCAGLMGFIQLNGDFLYIEPVNRTLAVTGQAHRVYRRKRSTTEERQTDKQTTDKQTSSNYCGVIPGGLPPSCAADTLLMKMFPFRNAEVIKGTVHFLRFRLTSISKISKEKFTFWIKIGLGIFGLHCLL
ncbi:unnamed protein product [Oncorhynchus mykiss]|uniref:Uncharacterized protein n=1 Tax=Oncorhynchus mykiss TaxID=8022 RepID=A0A060YC22_ONCMY|nr:unnamed protein product [Oncorhynchus mykiss]